MPALAVASAWLAPTVPTERSCLARADAQPRPQAGNGVVVTGVLGAQVNKEAAMSAHRRHAVAGIGISAMLLLGACSSGGSSAEPGRGAAAVGEPSASDATGPVASGPAPGQGPAAKDPVGARVQVSLQNQKLARTATLQVGVDDVRARAADVRRIAAEAGGTVTAEEISAVEPPPTPPPAPPGPPPPAPPGPPPPAPPAPPTPAHGTAAPPTPEPATPTPTLPERAPSSARGSGGTGEATTVRSDRGTLTIAVPSARLDAVLDRLSQLGSVTLRTSSSQDVTGTYVDTQSRLSTMRASVDRLRALMAQTTAVEQIVTLETELSRRLADLEALQAQLASLDAQVRLSTVTVTLTAAGGRVPGTTRESGFLAGLRQGWTTFVDVLVAVLTVLGAALPFLAAAAVLAVPGVLWWRHARAALPPARLVPQEAPKAREGRQRAQPPEQEARAPEEEE